MGKEAGMKGEFFFGSLLRDKGIEYTFENSWYDFLIKEKYKVEVKSCQLSVKQGKTNNIHVGRFDFTNKENRKRQINENIWICLLVRHRDQFIIYGFIRAKKLSGKRYLSIHQARELRPMDLEDWLLELYRE